MHLGTGVVVNTNLLTGESKRPLEYFSEDEDVPFTYNRYAEIDEQLIIFWENKKTTPFPITSGTPIILTRDSYHLLTPTLDINDIWNDACRGMFMCLKKDTDSLRGRVLTNLEDKWKPILEQKNACFPGQWLVYNLS